MVVPHPLNTMRNILLKNNFVSNNIDIRGQNIGNIGKLLYQLIDSNNVCDKCFIRNI